MITKLTTDLNIIQSLDAEPNDVTGLTYQQLQAKFDEGNNDVKTYINNTLTTEIDTNNVNVQEQISINNTNIQGQITTNNNDINSLKGRVTTNEVNITTKANTTDVYSKSDLDPFLRGGDTLIIYEVFSIVNSNNGNGTFTYTDKANNSIIGNLDVSGDQIFTLQQGNYELNSNKISAVINDTLQRSSVSGGLLEIDPTHIALTSPEGAGAEITIQYFERVGITGVGLIVQGLTEPPTGFFWYKEV